MDDMVRRAMEGFFGDDARRIAHAKEVFSHALRICEREGADRDVVAMAALLHDVGIKPAEERFGSSAGRYQEMLGPYIARGILCALGAAPAKIAEVERIIAHHHTPGALTTREFACIWDADMIVNLGEGMDRMDKAKIQEVVESTFLTKEGETIARVLLLRE